MIKHGEPPYLECSSKGDIRFSAFYAKVRLEDYAPRSIEEIYQGFKIFEVPGSNGMLERGLKWQQAKGRKARNQEECNELYSELWNRYIEDNPYLLEILKKASGLSDMFGQPGHCCQATELWRIRNATNHQRKSES